MNKLMNSEDGSRTLNIPPQAVQKIEVDNQGRVLVTVPDGVFVSDLSYDDTEAWRKIGTTQHNAKEFGKLKRK